MVRRRRNVMHDTRCTVSETQHIINGLEKSLCYPNCALDRETYRNIRNANKADYSLFEPIKISGKIDVKTRARDESRQSEFPHEIDNATLSPDSAGRGYLTKKPNSLMQVYASLRARNLVMRLMNWATCGMSNMV